MEITTRSGYTEPNNLTPSANNRDLCAFINHPDRWHRSFHKGLVYSDEEGDKVEEQDGMIGDENLIVSDSDCESESIGNAMEIGDKMEYTNGAVEGELDERNEEPMEDDNEADKDFLVKISDQASFAVTVKNVEKEECCLGSASAKHGSEVGKIEDESADSPQSDSADDNNDHVENLDPPTGKEEGRVTCTYSHCGETGHIRTGCKKHLYQVWEKKLTLKTKCWAENLDTSVGQPSFLCTHCGKKGHGRFQAKSYISHQNTPAQGAEKKDIRWRPVAGKNPVPLENSSPERNRPAAIRPRSYRMQETPSAAKIRLS